VFSTTGYRISQDTNLEHEPANEEWQPGFWIRLPALALFALATALAAGIALVAIVAFSNGAEADWRVSSAVLLAIAIAIGNNLIRYALDEGIAVSW
jgi:hypothetical protein